ncbi:4'-phosphopantetheinyl transferase sfp [compost metagenome]
MLKVFAVQITQFPYEYLNSILSYLPSERRQKHLKFRFLQDKLRGVTGDMLMRKVLSSMMDKPIDDIKIAVNCFGKPILLGHKQGIGFNISHSEDWVVLAIGPSTRIGVDVERINEVSLDLALRFFMDDEYQSIMKVTMAEHRLLQFFRIWTAKESYIKAIGKGLSIPLESFSTVNADEIASEKWIKGEKWYFCSYPLEDGYSLTVCSDKNCFDKGVTIIDIDSLVHSFFKAHKHG